MSFYALCAFFTSPFVFAFLLACISATASCLYGAPHKSFKNTLFPFLRYSSHKGSGKFKVIINISIYCVDKNITTTFRKFINFMQNTINLRIKFVQKMESKSTQKTNFSFVQSVKNKKLLKILLKSCSFNGILLIVIGVSMGIFAPFLRFSSVFWGEFRYYYRGILLCNIFILSLRRKKL